MLLDIQPGRLFSDHALAQYLDSGTVPEPEVVQVLFRALKPGTCAVDAGANVGFFTVLMSKLVGSEGFVIAIEPDKRNIDALMKNLDINDCKNVEIVTAPLAAKVEPTLFYENNENGQSSRFNSEGLAKMRALQTTTLTQVIGKRQPVLLKMDIEGAETEAVLGCEYRFPYVISEINETALRQADSSPEELIESLGAWGYAPHLLHADGSLPSRILASQKIKYTRANANLLFTKPSSVIDLWPEVEV